MSKGYIKVWGLKDSSNRTSKVPVRLYDTTPFIVKVGLYLSLGLEIASNSSHDSFLNTDKISLP